MSRLKALRLTAVAVLLSLGAYAQWPTPPKSTSYVNDYANLFKQDFVDHLNDMLKGFDNTDSVQMAVIITDKLPLDQSIEDYARNIGKDWHVGNYRNGIVFVWDVLGHRLRMEVARNMEPVLTDAQADGILVNMKTFLKAGQPAVGLETMIRQTITTVHTAHVAQQTVVDVKPKESAADWVGSHIWLIGFIIVLIGSGVLVFTWSRRNKEESMPETEGDGKIHTALGDEFEVDRYAAMKVAQNEIDRHRLKARTMPPPSGPHPRYEEPRREAPVYIAPVYTPSPTRSDDPPSVPSTPDPVVNWGGNDGGASAGFDGGGATQTY